MRRRYDVVAIGAGPAGALAAYAAARSGLDVLLVDRARFPRDKVCGCCLNARALGTLRAAGLGDLVAGLGASALTRLTVRAPSGVASLPLAGSAGLSRRRLDAAIVDRARGAGATFRDATAATVGPLEHDARRVRLASREGDTTDVFAAVVVVADGLGGTALRGRVESPAEVMPGSRIGAGVVVSCVPSGYPEGEISLACGRDGYVGTVRLEDGSLDVAAALAPEFVGVAGGPGAATERILEETGSRRIPGLRDLSWRGTPALTRRRANPAGERLFVVGDAAAYVEPFTGEGMAWAFEGALELSSWLPEAATRWDPALARRWMQRHRALARRRQWGCRAVAALLRRPRWTRGAVRLVARAPGIAAPLVRRLTQPLSG